MGLLIDQTQGAEPAQSVRCPICGHQNQAMQYCRHVRWTFDQGDPIDLARFAVETSPYVHARGASAGDIPREWWTLQGEWIVERVMLHFDACDGYVFGELRDLDLLARDIWLAFRPDPVRPSMVRVDP
jgi:hypothetical protein